MNTITIGVDLAKGLFSLCEVLALRQVLRRLDLRREVFAAWLAHLPAETVVAMESVAHPALSDVLSGSTTRVLPTRLWSG